MSRFTCVSCCPWTLFTQMDLNRCGRLEPMVVDPCGFCNVGTWLLAGPCCGTLLVAMIELPEAVTLARQMNEALSGQRIVAVTIAEKRPKWMFLNRAPEQYATKLAGVRVNEVTSDGKWIFTKLDTGEIFLLGEMFGRIRYHHSEEASPKKHHMLVTFDDESQLSITIQMWGCTQVLTPHEIEDHPHAGHRGPSPIDN